MSSAMQGRISVVIPARSEERFIGAAIGSVLAQGVDDLELIVVDDGSSDDTVVAAERAAGGRAVVLSQSAAGLAHARNRGFAQASAPFVLFLDADDELAPGGLITLRRCLEQDASAVVAYGEARIMDEEGCFIGAAPPPLLAPRPSGDVLSTLLERNVVATLGAALVRSTALNQAGAFRGELQRGEDWEALVRLATIGPFRYAGPRVVLHKRRRGGSLSSHYGQLGDGAASDAVFTHPAVKARYSDRQRRRLRRRHDAFERALAAVECLRQHRFPEARAHLREALALDPRRAREWILLACATVGVLPHAVGRRLK